MNIWIKWMQYNSLIFILFYKKEQTSDSLSMESKGLMACFLDSGVDDASWLQGNHFSLGLRALSKNERNTMNLVLRAGFVMCFWDAESLLLSSNKLLLMERLENILWVFKPFESSGDALGVFFSLVLLAFIFMPKILFLYERGIFIDLGLESCQDLDWVLIGCSYPF